MVEAQRLSDLEILRRAGDQMHGEVAQPLDGEPRDAMARSGAPA